MSWCGGGQNFCTHPRTASLAQGAMQHWSTCLDCAIDFVQSAGTRCKLSNLLAFVCHRSWNQFHPNLRHSWMTFVHDWNIRQKENHSDMSNCYMVITHHSISKPVINLFWIFLPPLIMPLKPSLLPPPPTVANNLTSFCWCFLLYFWAALILS